MTSVFDESGRFAPAYDESDLVTLEADACVLAIGQKPDLSFLKPADGVALTPAGTIAIDQTTLATSAPGIFAGGDVAFGPRNLIEAVANGKRAARSIHELLAKEKASIRATLEIEKIPTASYRMIAGFEILDREAPPTLDLGRRTGIAEVETGYAAPEARAQAARCLICHVQTIYDPGGLRPLQPLRGRLPGVLPRARAARGARPPRGRSARRLARRARTSATACRSRRWSRTTTAASAAACAPSGARRTR